MRDPHKDSLIAVADSNVETSSRAVDPSVLQQSRISAWMAGTHLIRTNLGAGVLNLPWAFCRVGSVWGGALCIVICAQGIYCMRLLAEIKLAMAPGHTITFAELTRITLGCWGHIFNQFCVFGLQTGCCIIFIQIVSLNIHEILLPWVSVSHNLVVLCLAPLFLLLSMLHTIHKLKWLSLMGNAFMGMALLSSIAASWAHITEQSVHTATTRQPSFSNINLFIGSMFFTFEGLGTVMPVSNAFNNSQRFPHVLTLSMSLLAFSFFLVGISCSMAYPSLSNGSVVAFLQHELGGAYWTAVNAMVTLAIGATYPLQLLPAVEVLGERLQSCLHPAHIELEQEGHTPPMLQQGQPSNSEAAVVPSVRKVIEPSRVRNLALTVFCIFVAFAVDDVSLMVAFVGSLCQTGIAMTPCLMHLALHWKRQPGILNPSASTCSMVVAVSLDIIVVIFCVAVVISGSITSLRSLVQDTSHVDLRPSSAGGGGS